MTYKLNGYDKDGYDGDGYDRDGFDSDGHTPLMNAAIDGNHDEYKRLLELGADPQVYNGIFGRKTAADYAAEREEKKTHKKLKNDYSSDDHISSYSSGYSFPDYPQNTAKSK